MKPHELLVTLALSGVTFFFSATHQAVFLLRNFLSDSNSLLLLGRDFFVVPSKQSHKAALKLAVKKTTSLSLPACHKHSKAIYHLRNRLIERDMNLTIFSKNDTLNYKVVVFVIVAWCITSRISTFLVSYRIAMR